MSNDLLFARKRLRVIGEGKNPSETLLGNTFQWWCEKGTGAEMRLAIVFGIVIRDSSNSPRSLCES